MNNKPFLAGILLLFTLASAPFRMFGEPIPPPAAQADNSGAGGPRVREFQGDDVGQVLRLLARQAKVDLVVADGVEGKVSMRLENKSALDAIEIVVHSNKLAMTKDDKGVYYVGPPAEASTDDDADKTSLDAATEEAANTALNFLAKPDTAGRIARYKRNLFNALVKEGFTAEQAVQIVAADRAGEVFSSAGGGR